MGEAEFALSGGLSAVDLSRRPQACTQSSFKKRIIKNLIKWHKIQSKLMTPEKKIGQDRTLANTCGLTFKQQAQNENKS